MGDEGDSSMRPLVDVKIVQGVDNFNGEDDKWCSSCFEFENAVANIGLDDLVRHTLEVEEQQLRSEHMDPEAQRRNKALYILLSAKLKGGKARGILKGAPKGCGFIVWKRLKKEYEGDAGIRHTAMLTGLINTDWEKQSGSSSRPFFQLLQDWENAIEDYVMQSRQPFPDNLKISVVMTHAPPDVRMALRSSQASIGGSYERLKDIVR